MPGPIATIGSMHLCPMCNGMVPHVGGPLTGPGATNILINNKPAAIMGDICLCAGPPDMIVQGTTSVLFNGVPVACIGDMTAHGGIITTGEANVTISTATPTPSAIMPPNKIPFPKITVMNKIMASLAGHSLKEAQVNQEKLKEQNTPEGDEEVQPEIYNLRWIKQQSIIRREYVIKRVLLKASVAHIGDGATITFKLKTPPDLLEDGKKQVDAPIITLTGTVKGKEVEVCWEVKDPEENPSTENQLA